MTLLGRVQAANGASLTFAPDLHSNQTQADQFETQVLGMIYDSARTQRPVRVISNHTRGASSTVAHGVTFGIMGRAAAVTRDGQA